MSSLNDRVSAVLAKIAETQADSLQGVLTKLRIWEEDGMDAGTPAEAVWDSAVADLRRLTGEASS